MYRSSRTRSESALLAALALFFGWQVLLAIGPSVVANTIAREIHLGGAISGLLLGWLANRRPAEPHGAFYIYADCGRDAREYCLRLLEREAVAATPGVDFGANGTERHVRFAYTRAMGDIEEAARRIRRFAACAPSA